MGLRRRANTEAGKKNSRALRAGAATYAALVALSLAVMWQTPQTIPLFHSSVALSTNQQLTAVYFHEDDPGSLWESNGRSRPQIKPDRLWAEDRDWLKLSPGQRSARLGKARSAHAQQYPDTVIDKRGPSPLTRPLAVDGDASPPLSAVEQHARLADGAFLPPDAHIALQAPAVQEWLARGEIPGASCDPLLASLGLSAMADIAVMGPATWGDDIPLTFSDGDPVRAVDGAIVAGFSPHWRYVWPRDSSAVAAALARTGHGDDAARILKFLAHVQRADGSFAPRYLPDGSGLPWDMRRDQGDAPGWVLWATAELVEAGGRASAGSDFLSDEIRGMAQRAYGRIIHTTVIPSDEADPADPASPAVRIPRPSSDFTEVKESATPLSVPLANLMGLEAAARLRAADPTLAQMLTPSGAASYWLSSEQAQAGEQADSITHPTGESDYDDPHTRPLTPPWAIAIPDRYVTADGATTLENDVRDLIISHYGPTYHRYSPDPLWDRLRGRTGPDVGLALAGPPFISEPLSGVSQVQDSIWESLARAGGGLAPTSAWARDGVSWTPSTLWMALSAAGNGDDERANAALRWAAQHRTAAGSLPEKVLANGNPAAVAPLVWSSALAVLTLLELGEACL